MPYVGQKVSDLFGPAAQAATKAAARAMCDTAGDHLEKRARELTPVDTGRLREGWKRTPAVSAGEGWATEVSNDVDYAAYVENGTGLYGPKHSKYLIKPKKPGGVLRWVGKDGKVHFAKFVMHPGSEGKFMLATAMNETEAEAAGPLFAGDLAAWVEAVERTASH